MKTNLYSVYDKKSQKFDRTNHWDNDAVASRAIQQELRNPQSFMAMFPDDFALYCVGIYDDETGIIESACSTDDGCPSTRFVVDATDLKNLNL